MQSSIPRFWVSCGLRLQSKKMGSENLTITDFQTKRSLNPISLFMRELPLSPSQVAASLCLYPLRARELIRFQGSLLHYGSAQNIQTFCFIKWARLALETFQSKSLLFYWESKGEAITSTALETGWTSSQPEVTEYFMRPWTALRAKSVIPPMPETLP